MKLRDEIIKKYLKPDEKVETRTVAVFKDIVTSNKVDQVEP